MFSANSTNRTARLSRTPNHGNERSRILVRTTHHPARESQHHHKHQRLRLYLNSNNFNRSSNFINNPYLTYPTFLHQHHPSNLLAQKCCLSSMSL